MGIKETQEPAKEFRPLFGRGMKFIPQTLTKLAGARARRIC
jgi:hypothetical protein